MSHFMHKTEAIAALRAAADLIEKLDIDTWFVEAQAYHLTAEALATAARLPGTWTKDVSAAEMFQLSQGIVQLHANRDQVCVAKPTGRTRTVKKVVVPPVYEDVEVPELDWDCTPLLSREAS